jgi:predicted PurR-regulated permease PerM
MISELDRERGFLLVSSIFVSVLVFKMLSPYLSYLLMGLLLAFVTFPLHERLSSYLGDSISAGLVVLITVFAFVLPFVIILGAVGGDAAQIVSDLNNNSSQIIQEAEIILTELTGRTVDIQKQVREAASKAASLLPSGLSSAIRLLSDLSIGISVMLFLQFYAVRDGKSFVEWTKGFDFLSDDKRDRIYSSASNSIWAVIKGHVLMAFAQGILAGIALFIAGVPNVFFWTFLMIILGFIPLIGSALVWVPAAIYLAIQEQIIMAVFILLYGLIIIGGSDNILRPLVVDESAGIHPFFILIGLIGGVGLFGIAGIFLGPVTFGVFGNLLDMVQETQ